MLEKCYEKCSITGSNESTPIEQDISNYVLSLVCREDTTLVVKITENVDEVSLDDESSKRAVQTNEQFDGRLYVVKVQEGGNIFTPKIVYTVSY